MNVNEAAKARPLISAVLCTFNRADLLARALGGLCGQTLSPEQFEVVVIDDGSSDRTRQIVESFQSLLPLRYAFQENAGLASGKNHGLFLSSAPIVFFLDDDDVADSRLLEQHCRTHRKFPQPEYAVLGYTDLADSVARSPLMRYVTQVGCHLFSYPALKDGALLDFSYFWGGRSSCKRAFLLDHGVFNPIFRFGAEDIELGFRLSKAGLRVVYDQQAVSHMIRAMDFDGFCRRCYMQGQSNWVFSQLQSDPQVQSWTRVANLEAEWRKLEPRFENILKSARALDRFALARSNADLPLDELTVNLLHRAYGEAFSASRVRGTIEKALSDRESIPSGRETIIIQ
jgi:glycosyltransferase involved in cell wall biosynthesis